MKNAEPYLIFDGECAEAFTFYEIVFAAKIAFLTHYKDLPPGTGEVAEADRERVVHVILPISKEVSLMGADCPSGMKNTRGDNVWLTLNTESADEARQVFGRLSEGGKMTMPLEKTFWAELYGMLTDKFGICWMVNYQVPSNNR
ncbi:VOC family protein [Dysgonomonas sp. Marseille-P4677]|uniref:VOC family protein n=1 Tax=Dysgonomonas sp. Marseille-P4677 TaxID=2364790 RepID=UPI001913B358|nr:VOC family protein [Dysgonomonas sp. Marseille-P4677]MBK5720366.1 VOC family protein [Dysgonomonas sp. Marseille-P4677]